MKTKKIAILGGGNIGTAIAEGFVKSGSVTTQNITVTQLKNRLYVNDGLKKEGIQVITDNKKAVAEADVVFACVKPQYFETLLTEIKDEIHDGQILISIVTGASLDYITGIAGNKGIWFRAMPNTAMSIQESMTCIATNDASEEEKELVVKLFEELGKAVLIHEDLMGAATVLASCGVAFALRYIRAAMQGGIEIGFSAELAELISAQTVKGATELVLQHGTHPEQEIDKVTTPQGITITGLNEMEHAGFSSAVIQGLMTSFNKIYSK